MHPRDTSYTIKLMENTVFMLQDRGNNAFRFDLYCNVVAIYKVACTIDFAFCELDVWSIDNQFLMYHMSLIQLSLSGYISHRCGPT